MQQEDPWHKIVGLGYFLVVSGYNKIGDEGLSSFKAIGWTSLNILIISKTP